MVLNDLLFFIVFGCCFILIFSFLFLYIQPIFLIDKKNIMYIFQYTSPFPLATYIPGGGSSEPITVGNMYNNNGVIHDVQLTQYVSGCEVFYDLELKIFGDNISTEEEILREACSNIIKDADNRLQQERLKAHDQHPICFRLGMRMYRCLTKRQSDDQIFCVMGDFPPI